MYFPLEQFKAYNDFSYKDHRIKCKDKPCLNIFLDEILIMEEFHWIYTARDYTVLN